MENLECERIVHLDCGRKYFSVEEIKSLIDICAQGNVSMIELSIGNDGLRFLLDDMSVLSYSSEQIKAGIHLGNEEYSDFPVDELIEMEMDEIITYAHSNNINIIPLINTPGHMDSILSSMEYCGIQNANYSNSVRTMDLSNKEAVDFSMALLEKYVSYFSGKRCTYFNIGADEYANDIHMGFGQLIKKDLYGKFTDYVNNCGKLVKSYNMIPMVFNDGIYYNNRTDFGTFDSNLVICYWTNGGFGNYPCSAKQLEEYGFSLINTNSDYYWVLGNSRWQCDVEKMKRFNVTQFKGSTISQPFGAMYCIWCDDPKADSGVNVIRQNQEVILEFGK
ncbi:MAG: family 20 glycosylhydrolase [Bacillota bacterium]|nr:family 20 glycosylhydrolase [Bacillota bacterium]